MKIPQTIVAVAGLVVMVACSIESVYAITRVGSPEDAWSYSKQVGAVGNLNFFPTDTSEFASATFVDYVTYTHPAGGQFRTAPIASKGFHVFRTWVTSESDQDLFFINGGDDGHSVFVDGDFIAGAGFGVNVTGNISLQARVPRELTVVTHNALGEMHANFNTEPTQDRLLEDTPGISISAVLVPEPAASTLLLAGLRRWQHAEGDNGRMTGKHHFPY